MKDEFHRGRSKNLVGNLAFDRVYRRCLPVVWLLSDNFDKLSHTIQLLT